MVGGLGQGTLHLTYLPKLQRTRGEPGNEDKRCFASFTSPRPVTAVQAENSQLRPLVGQGNAPCADGLFLVYSCKTTPATPDGPQSPQTTAQKRASGGGDGESSLPTSFTPAGRPERTNGRLRLVFRKPKVTDRWGRAALIPGAIPFFRTIAAGFCTPIVRKLLLHPGPRREGTMGRVCASRHPVPP